MGLQDRPIILLLISDNQRLDTLGILKKTRCRNLFHPIGAALTGSAAGLELDKRMPRYEVARQLALGLKLKSCRERVSEFSTALSLGSPHDFAQ